PTEQSMKYPFNDIDENDTFNKDHALDSSFYNVKYSSLKIQHVREDLKSATECLTSAIMSLIQELSRVQEINESNL
ncbi:hypothetical protein GJ496_000167, partial [Pomphorhynchus laevis]